MKEDNLIKRMGHGKNADINGKERGSHIGDNKRTTLSIFISKKHHERSYKNRRENAIIALNYNTELWNYYGPIFKEQ